MMPVDRSNTDATVPPAVFSEYCRAVHDLNNSLAAANMRLELYQLVTSSDGESPECSFAEVTRAMRELMTTCQTVAARLGVATANSAQNR